MNTGKQVSVIGLGTWLSKPDEVRKAVKQALDTGYRHLDCAYVYRNEDEVGQGIRESGVPREDIFITSKVPFYILILHKLDVNININIALEYSSP